MLVVLKGRHRQTAKHRCIWWRAGRGRRSRFWHLPTGTGTAVPVPTYGTYAERAYSCTQPSSAARSMRQPDVVTSRPTPPPPEVSLRTHSTPLSTTTLYYYNRTAFTVRFTLSVSHTYPRADVSKLLRYRDTHYPREQATAVIPNTYGQCSAGFRRRPSAPRTSRPLTLALPSGRYVATCSVHHPP